MAGILLKIRTWWETADRTQKSVTLFGGGFLLLLLVGAFYFATRPKMEMAFAGLTPAEQGSVVEEIQKIGIPVEFDLGGNVLVPSAKVSEVKMRLATAGKLPNSTHWGYGDLKDWPLTTTPQVEKERLKSVMEGELAKTIESFSSVESARVHINLSQESVFAGEKSPATASVTIAEKSGASISGDESKAIASLVANAVPGLNKKNLTIVDKDLKPIWLGTEDTGAQGLAGERIQAEIAESKRREQELQQKLDYFFGPRAAVVTVDLKLDFDTATEQRSEPIVGDEAVSKERVKETMTGGAGTRPGGVTGLDSNTGAPGSGGGPTGSESSGYVSDQSTEQRPYGERRTETQKSPGDVKSMAISVLVDPKKVTDQKAVQAFVTSYLGSRASDPNFTAKVTALERTAEAEAISAAAAPSGSNVVQQIFSLLPVVALLVVAFVVVKSIGKAAKAQSVFVAALPGGRAVPMAISQAETQIVRREGEAQATQPKPLAPQFDDLEDIPSKVNRPLEQIKKMTADRPEVVAMLIKSWLLEERR